MKKASIITMCLAFIVLCAACGASQFPEDVQIYADKHGVKCYSSEQASKECKVGESCVVCGTVTYAYFTDLFEGSSVLNKALDGKEGAEKAAIEASLSGTMRYSIELDHCTDCKITYEGYNFEPNKLNIGQGDVVAFSVKCKDDSITHSYEYVVDNVIWMDKKSAATVEEEFYAKEGIVANN